MIWSYCLIFNSFEWLNILFGFEKLYKKMLEKNAVPTIIYWHK